MTASHLTMPGMSLSMLQSHPVHLLVAAGFGKLKYECGIHACGRSALQEQPLLPCMLTWYLCPGNNSIPMPGSSTPPTSTPAPISATPMPATISSAPPTSARDFTPPPSAAVPHCTADIQPGVVWNNYDGTYMSAVNIVRSLPCILPVMQLLARSQWPPEDASGQCAGMPILACVLTLHYNPVMHGSE